MDHEKAMKLLIEEKMQDNAKFEELKALKLKATEKFESRDFIRAGFIFVSGAYDASKLNNKTDEIKKFIQICKIHQ